MPRVRSRAARTVRRLLVCGTVALLLLVGTAVALDLWLVSGVTRVDGVFEDVGDRPAEGDGTTFLMLGTIASDAEEDARVSWLPDSPSLESVMVVHVLDDRRHVTVESLAPDPALTAEVTGDPARAVAATETRTGRRVDHLLVVDWAALQQLADDNGTGLTYRPGSTVRQQQRFLRAVLEDTLHAELRHQPWNVYAALRTMTQGMAVEQGWSVLAMDRLVLSLRNLRSADIDFRTR